MAGFKSESWPDINRNDGRIMIGIGGRLRRNPHAAALQGRTVTDFVLTSVQDAARRAIEEHQHLSLSVRDSEAFVKALTEPQPVNDRLRETIRLYRAKAGV